VAERNPSKQRRQAQNRAARDARKARSVAANTPVEERRIATEDEPEKGRRSRRRRPRKSQDEIRAEARALVEAEAEAEAEVEAEVEVEADGEGDDLTDVAVEEIDVDTVDAPATVGVRRGSSPVFSARHRAAIAASTAGRAPARTHVGVAEATGTEVVGPNAGPLARRSGGGAKGSSPRNEAVKASAPGGARRNHSSSQTAGDATGRSRAGTGSPGRRTPTRPPAKPLPPFFDRFGGNEPGGRWVLLSFATVVLASIVLNFVHIIPEVVENAKGKKIQTGKYFTIWHFGLGPGLMFLAPPILILGLFIITARPWDRRRSWNFALALLTLSTFLTQSISIYIIPIGCLAWGCWKARKAALEDVGGDPQVLREVERERRIAGKEAMRARRRPS